MDEQFVHEDQMRNARTQGVGSMVSEQNRQNALELIINTEPYDSVFGSRHNYTAISVRNNYGLNNIGDPTSYVKSSDVKLKETDANGNKIGSSLSVN